MKAPSLLKHVPPQLPADGTCKIAFVGEAPSDYERLYGFPLVGPSGRTFDQILRVSGLAADGDTQLAIPERARRVQRLLKARAPYLVTNVFDEQLPGGQGKQANSVAGWCASATERLKWKDYDLPIIRGSGYLRPEYVTHLTRLASELEQSKPNLIVPLGATALWALTGVSDISIARGAVSQCTMLAPGVKILPTYHPAHVQQEWRLFHVAVSDLVKAAKEAEFPDVRLVKRRIHIRPSVADLAKWEKALLSAPRLAVDIETSKQQITCIGFATGPETAYVIPFADFSKASRSYWPTVEQEALAWGLVRRVCESAIPKTLQNGLYDVYYLIRQAGIWVNGYADDTRLQHHALYPELPKSLAFMGATYAQQGPWKLMRQNRSEKRDE
jgi:uracil-DNA glycosylase